MYTSQIILQDISARNPDTLQLVQDQYDPVFEKQVQASQVVTINDVKGDRLAKGGNYRLIYHTKDNFKKFAKSLGLMDDFKLPKNTYMLPINSTYDCEYIEGHKGGMNL
ncbi:Alpha-1,3-mannosyl-glycoprotein 2-beta-N-acetylglucosaminyltransferase [Chionoecetes opilio]|uniref:Alpha-1,3-mannosyl-glycoprotein 2-beta-N-acetylglucosaminyltransferase n=1 Tax=Chionoecetes opilio TaxID=41210 RepID=A0A8J4Y3X6_CHIOP|nr:Alpha-1,3-mannosyl-glycoprotein 2-beta-N-acetylglucosaminyltransferase [Chionoecetes opilio]